MGRYTTVQTYTDQDAKVATISYSVETSVEPNALANKNANEKAHKDVKNSDERFHFNRVDNVLGSSAGAGSGEFHVYRASRRRYFTNKLTAYTKLICEVIVIKRNGTCSKDGEGTSAEGRRRGI